MFGDPSPCSIKALVLDKALNEAHMNHMEYYNKILPKMKETHRRREDHTTCKIKDSNHP